jgi:hypothetical protein
MNFMKTRPANLELLHAHRTYWFQNAKKGSSNSSLNANRQKSNCSTIRTKEQVVKGKGKAHRRARHEGTKEE